MNFVWHVLHFSRETRNVTVSAPDGADRILGFSKRVSRERGGRCFQVRSRARSFKGAFAQRPPPAPGGTSKTEDALQRHAVRLLALTLFSCITEPQSERARGPKREPGAQHRFVARQTDPLHRHPVIEPGEAGLESVTILMDRAAP